MKKESMSSGGRCTCGPGNFLWMIAAVVLFAIGLWLVVGGLFAQWNQKADWLMVMVWYAVGFLILGFGKMCKWKSMNCPAHCMG